MVVHTFVQASGPIGSSLLSSPPRFEGRQFGAPTTQFQ
jgi:hypothetical protein